MNIAEMHVWFRQYAQQMGMQNVRAILPEQIDLLINSAISDAVNQVIIQNVGITNDRIITDNSKIGQINALRSLYKVINVDASVQTSTTIGKPFVKGEETTVYRLSGEVNKFIDSKKISTAGADYKFNYLFLVDLAINYKDNSSTPKVTNLFPVRLIDEAYLADTINDFILKPRLRTPVAVLYNDTLDIYVDDLDNGALPFNLKPDKLRVSYIAKPAKVRYASDLGGSNVDCDLPDYMHVDILKAAVDLYRVATNGSLMASRQNEQNQQREMVRNTYRPQEQIPQ